MRPNLLIVCAGDSSLHPRWLAGGKPRNFDLLVSYYGATPERFRADGDIYHAMPGPRWPAHHAIYAGNRELLGRYQHVAFACDDLDATTDTWNRLFNACEWYELDLAQPAIEGYISREITRPQPGCLLRYTSYVEIMCAVLSRRALARLGGTFAESVSGWGLPYLWSKLLPYPEFKLAIVDSIRVHHTTPVRQGSLRPTLDALGIDPLAEMRQVMARHGIVDPWIGEHARLPIVHGTDGGLTLIADPTAAGPAPSAT